MKEKTYRICHGSRHTQKQCSLCNEKFPSQKYSNDRVSSVHSFQFLCKSRACGKVFTSQAALEKHELTHQGPCFFCTVCGNRFLFKYQLNSHANMHVDFVIRCCYPMCGKVYKSEGEYRRHKKSPSDSLSEVYMYHMWQKLFGKKYRDEHMALHLDKLKNECPKCSKNYRWHSSLSKHMAVKHPPTPHPPPERSSSPEF